MARYLPHVVLTVILAAPVMSGSQAPAQIPATPPSPSSPDQQQADNNPTQPARAGQPAGPDSSKDDKDVQKKKGLKRRLKDQFSSGCTNFGPCWGKDKESGNPDQQASAGSPNNPPPRSDGRASDESSSSDTKIDLGPPPGEPGHAPAAETGAPDVREMRPWDPHKAEKNIEIGDYYLKQKNYRAAISRYREALYWKENDAIAQLRLGQALEAVGQYAEARRNYNAYLKLLPQGRFAPDARKALERLNGLPDDPTKAQGPIL